MRRFDDALASFDRAIELAPDQELLYGIRGSIKTKIGRPGEALEDYGQALSIIAAGKPSTQGVVEDCIRLLSVDKIPAIYASEAELAETRNRVESTLEELEQKYATADVLSADQTLVSEHAIRYLTGFYLAYHQRNDRETMRKLSTVAARLLALDQLSTATREARWKDPRRHRVATAAQPQRC